MKHAFLILLVVALLAAAIPTAVASPQAHQIVSVITVDAGDTIASYQVIDDPTLNGISHVVIPACLPGLLTVQGCPGEVELLTNADPTTGVAGVKCDAGGSYTLTMIFGGELETATANASIKYGPTFSLAPVEVVTCASLGVVMAAFTATAQGSDVLLEWETMSEWDNLGFNVYRGQSPERAAAVQIAHVPSLVPGGTFGQVYEYLDPALDPGEYWYWLKDVSIYNYGFFHDPATVTVHGPTAVTVASFMAAPASSSCYRTGSGRKPVCVCGKYIVPMIFCKARR